MRDAVYENFTRSSLCAIIGIVLAVPVKQDVEFRNFGYPAAIYLSIKFNREIHTGIVALAHAVVY